MSHEKNMIAILHYSIQAIDGVLKKDREEVRKISEKKQQMTGNAKFSNKTAKDQQKMDLLYSEIGRLEKARKVASQLLANSQHNESFYKTIITSSQWNDWVKLQEYEIEFDVHESIECGVISNNHWQAFLEFIKTT